MPATRARQRIREQDAPATKASSVGPPATLPPVRAGSTPARRHRVLTARLPELSPG
ncbi:hypothetical protein I551_4043 [Mycobacterium ulcerans str. Harvey]|uniref:Uncharacterized protein n=1 Tax=Mycobacterium ulcerans str. Harvey TaxID=1299332 RepID=A0ABN0QXT8_MYCUL|nr:hypothetical protein I551_4043 [Mycobacterium ulcerans str. Harvey]